MTDAYIASTPVFPGAQILAFGQIGSPSAGKVFGRGLAGWQLRRVAEHVRSNLDRCITLAELAGLVRLSRFHFCTAFRLATGQTPRDWITGERIRRAVALLEAHELNITEIALEVGYETPSSFTARFRQLMGVTPSDYRRAL
ncbi:MAG: AraC family transcriptional regulator [Pseudomonadota bacterium]